MRALEPFILLIVIHYILDGILLKIAAFVYSFFCKSRSYYIELTKMPAAVAILTTAIFLIVMRKVVIRQMFSCLRKEFFLSLALFLVVLEIMGLRCLVEWRVTIGRLCQHFISTFVLYLKIRTFRRGNTVRFWSSASDKHQ